MTDRLRALWPGEVAPWAEDGATEAGAPPRPSAVALVAVFVFTVVAWWPYGDSAYWKSDDFLAIWYSADFGRALGDFTHRQYDLGGAVSFYRPLITLSFALEQLVAGAEPLVAHASNAIAQAASAVLVALIASRFTSAAGAVVCGLAWATMPSHAGAVLWAVGRVDSHTTVWVLTAVLASLRQIEQRRFSGLLAAVAFAGALCSKESAVVVPAIAFVCALALGRPRVRAAWDVTWPLAALLLIYLGWRLVAFGSLGGYEGELRPWPALAGFATFTMRLANPLTYSGGAVCDVPDWGRWLAFLPVALAVAAVLKQRRFGLLATLIALYVVACAPLYVLLEHSGNLINLRYLHLPSVALAALLVAGGWLPGVLALAVWALPFVELRQDYEAQSVENRLAHGLLLGEAPELGGQPTFIHGLPRQNAKGTVLAMHVGTDRLLRRPFTEHVTPTYALRPLSDAEDAYRIPYGDELGLPVGVTLALDGTRILARLTPARLAKLDVDLIGSPRLGSRRLYELGEKRRETGSVEGTTYLIASTAYGTSFRVTLFTGMGYLTALVDDADGRFDLVFDMLWFEFAGSSPHRWAQALRVASSVDREPRFPLLVEAGRVESTPAGPLFRPAAASRELVWIELDREFADLMRGRVPLRD